MTKALIAGGGIGGLTVALCLRHFGWTVEVLEQAYGLGDIGAGIQISPNAMKVFEALGLGDVLTARGFRPEAIELRMGKSGKRLIRAPLDSVAHKRWGASYLHVHRADLVSILGAALSQKAPETIRFGARIDRYEQDESGVKVQLKSGDCLEGDILIGADGIHSVVRAQMLGPDTPLFTGNVAWRAVVPVERLGNEVPDPVVCAWFGKGRHAVTYLLRGGEFANLVAVVERDNWTSESWTQAGGREEALEDFKGWHPYVTRMLGEAEKLYRWALFDRAPLKSWSEGRVVILGDAAHPMLPFMAQGAAMAIEDAWALAACLDKTNTVSAAFAAYQGLRYQRATRIQAGSRANAKMFHQSTLPGQIFTYGPMWLAGRLAPVIGLARQDSVYGYDIVAEAQKYQSIR